MLGSGHGTQRRACSAHPVFEAGVGVAAANVQIVVLLIANLAVALHRQPEPALAQGSAGKQVLMQFRNVAESANFVNTKTAPGMRLVAFVHFEAGGFHYYHAVFQTYQ